MSCMSGKCGGGGGNNNHLSGNVTGDHHNNNRISGGGSGNCHLPAMRAAPTLYGNEHELAKEERHMDWLYHRLAFQPSIPRGYCCPAQCVGSNTSNCGSKCQTQSSSTTFNRSS